MRLVLLDKNCNRQNGILGEPRRLEKWFAYLATLTRKTNSAVVEQHGLVHQWRSSSGPKKERFGVLTKIRDSKKWFYGRTNESRKTVPSPGSSQWWAALACTIAAWIFGKLAEWEQKISLMRLVLLDKNCTRQNGILGEPRRLEKWFAYLATLTRKTNSAVVEQLGLVHQWRSSSGPKRSVLAFLTKVRDSKKWFYRRTNESRKTVPSPGSSQWWAALACTIAAWIFGKLAEWEQKISLMRLVLLDKNCTRQNGILGEPRRLEKWFAYLATLNRKTNSAVVSSMDGAPVAEQQRPKKGAFWRFWPKFEIPKNGSTDKGTREGKRFLALAVRSGEQHWPVL